MKNSIIVAVALALACAGCGAKGGPEIGRTLRSSPRIEALRASALDPEKRKALDRVAKVYAGAHYHLGAIQDLAVVLAGASHNADAIAYAGELMARATYHTETLLDVAKEAARATLEIPEFREITELAVLNLSGGEAVPDLARRAADMSDPAGLPALKAEIARMRDETEFKTIEAAQRAVDETMKRISEGIKTP
jgi:hypothetical protein